MKFCVECNKPIEELGEYCEACKDLESGKSVEVENIICPEIKSEKSNGQSD